MCYKTISRLRGKKKSRHGMKTTTKERSNTNPIQLKDLK